MSEISIVIPNYILNQELLELTKNCINSFKKTTSDYELILVDDGSLIGSDYLKKEADIYIKHKKNKGFAPSVNDGWKKSKGEYIITANNDIEVFGDWFNTFLKWYNFTEGMGYKVGAIGGLGFRSRIVEGMPIEQFKGWKSGSIGGQFKDWMFPGGFYLLKREVLEKIGYLDENFIHGGYEDVDYFYRIQQAGYSLLMVGEVIYWHKEGATRWTESQYSKFKGIEAQNLDYFIKKWKFNPHQVMFSKIFQQKEINYLY